MLGCFNSRDVLLGGVCNSASTFGTLVMACDDEILDEHYEDLGGSLNNGLGLSLLHFTNKAIAHMGSLHMVDTEGKDLGPVAKVYETHNSKSPLKEKSPVIKKRMNNDRQQSRPKQTDYRPHYGAVRIRKLVCPV